MRGYNHCRRIEVLFLGLSLFLTSFTLHNCGFLRQVPFRFLNVTGFPFSEPSQLGHKFQRRSRSRQSLSNSASSTKISYQAKHHAYLYQPHNLIKLKGSFYIAQYPVGWTAQTSKRFTLFALPGRPVHSDTNLASPGFREAF